VRDHDDVIGRLLPVAVLAAGSVGLNERANRAPDGQLERRMFVVLDEAGNQRLEDLPSTPPPSPGSGATGDHLAVRAQITKAYGPAAGIVLTNHLSTVFDAGLSDQDAQLRRQGGRRRGGRSPPALRPRRHPAAQQRHRLHHQGGLSEEVGTDGIEKVDKAMLEPPPHRHQVGRVPHAQSAIVVAVRRFPWAAQMPHERAAVAWWSSWWR
jgi:hypothetical protein